jgi:ABC-type sugar transport system ATPase subunit
VRRPQRGGELCRGRGVGVAPGAKVWREAARQAAKELSRRSTDQTLYILDERPTGLHLEDVRKLLEVLHRLVEQRNSVVVIEHNPVA